MPYFGKRICEGNFNRHDFVKGVRELYAANKSDPAAFIDAMGDALYEQYEFQRLTKKISSGTYLVLSYIGVLTYSLFRKCHLYNSPDKVGAQTV